MTTRRVDHPIPTPPTQSGSKGTTTWSVEDVQPLVIALASAGQDAKAEKVQKHGLGRFMVSKCAACGDRLVKPQSCDHPLCPRCRKRLNQRHATELRRFAGDIQTISEVRVEGPLDLAGWKRTVRRSHRKFAGCYRVDVKPIGADM